MCFEEFFSCQEPCWPVNDLLPARTPDVAGVSCHSLSPIFKATATIPGIDPQPAGDLQAPLCHGIQGIYGLSDHRPADAKSRDNEKQVRRENVIDYLPGEMPGSSPQYERPWYVVGD
ncbi:MAG: hypothetical protein O8C61_05545 [Candidatus Methanoperedens sp.]|nr:hypothetical protein [Candidatus Methanoperedens sp.]